MNIMSEGSYEEYQEGIKEDVKSCLEETPVQPILLIGSGLSQRYFSGPSWDRLLSELVEQCPLVPRQYAYYKQKHESPIDIGTELAEYYREWAWGDGSKHFPEELFDPDQPPDVYLKYRVSVLFEELVEQQLQRGVSDGLQKEINAMQKVHPHAIITTNYDRFLENLFPEYEPIIGQKILTANYQHIGEIFKIHGCASDPNSLVLTRKDYDSFFAKKKYLSAKLLTFFAEHPLLILGYSASDPNIQAILSDIDEILSPKGELIPNIYLVQWYTNPEGSLPLQSECLIPIGDERSVRIKTIIANDFTWIYEAFASNEALPAVNPQVLRALMARTYSLVRHDIPKRTVEIDYATLENVTASEESLAKLYGITTLNSPSDVNARYPYSLTHVAEKLGYGSWHYAHQLIQRVRSETGINIKESDNNYHIAIKSGKVGYTHKYSEAAVALLEAVRDGQEYTLDMDTG